MLHGDIDIRVISSLDDLEKIGDEWNAVQDACEHEHVLLDHRFITAWWRSWGRGKSMHTLVLRHRGTVQGVVPLVLSRGWEAFPTRGKNVRMAEDFRYLPAMRWRRFTPIRRLSFPLSFPSSNIRAHLLLRHDDSAQIEAVLSYCEGIRERWDVMSLDGIPDGSEQERFVEDAAARVGLARGKARHRQSFLRAKLPTSMDALLAQRSKNFRRGLRRAARQSIERTADLGELHIREFRGDAIDDGITKLLNLERRSWKVKRTKKRELHLSLDDESRSFHRNVARAFAAADEAQVLVTEIGGQPANALYSLERRGIIACVLTYQADEFADRVSVAPLWRRFFEIAIERGLRMVDFNGNNTYLARYADGEAQFNRLVFYNRGWYSSSLRAVADGAVVLARTLSR